MVPYIGTMQKRHERTLARIFSHPTPSGLAWRDVEAMLVALGADIEERAGSRVLVKLNGRRLVAHRPHPRPEMDKGAVADMRDFLTSAGVKR